VAEPTPGQPSQEEILEATLKRLTEDEFGDKLDDLVDAMRRDVAPNVSSESSER
jgi:hypothetical protein